MSQQDAEYVEKQFRRALSDDVGPVEYVRVKVEGPYGSSHWVRLYPAEFETMIGATVAAVTERGE